MILSIIILLLNSCSVFLYKYQKPLEEKVWSERCKRNSVVLNDCNWCWCDDNQRFQCKARVCEEVDMFGHFKDAIQDIDVGMEGHGAWRSKKTSCTPGVHYERGSVLCVCDEDGNWPNPVCRELFRVLHPVEVTDQIKPANNETCSPTKLYLVGCNVCYCPSSGWYDPQLCTKKECGDGDPVLEANENLETSSTKSNMESKDLEIYAACNPDYTYKLNSMNCECLRNNRLICNNNTTDTSNSERSSVMKNRKSYCNNRRPFSKFNIDCNMCHCDSNQNLYCTVKKCIQNNKFKNRLKLNTNPRLRKVPPPPMDEVCTPGTTYKRDCNTCRCMKQNDVKIIDCTTNSCYKRNVMEDQKCDCVSNTLYEMDCKICYCQVIKNIKRQFCQINPQCFRHNEVLLQDKGSKRNVDTLHGYCEPLHEYKKDCNDCRCLADGKTLMCSSKICTKRTVRDSEVISVDVVPVYMNGFCPNGHSYKLDCNTCFCLSNGNAICTTINCYDENTM